MLSKFIILVCLFKLRWISLWFDVVVSVEIIEVLFILGLFLRSIGLFNCIVCIIFVVFFFVDGVESLKLFWLMVWWLYDILNGVILNKLSVSILKLVIALFFGEVVNESVLCFCVDLNMLVKYCFEENINDDDLVEVFRVVRILFFSIEVRKFIRYNGVLSYFYWVVIVLWLNVCIFFGSCCCKKFKYLILICFVVFLGMLSFNLSLLSKVRYASWAYVFDGFNGVLRDGFIILCMKFV